VLLSGKNEFVSQNKALNKLANGSGNFFKFLLTKMHYIYSSLFIHNWILLNLLDLDDLFLVT
jgi:hypothetical protein